ncbi:MAG: NAD-dependent protein deacylase [Acidobacteria bacterium]|nr:MAG: NAD-dependent protein deacylase [Acidobacteriota bacterium]RLE22821.1 MAG: NAD-dependent protein deacylase [Acidobacteriota bacterium]
MNVVVMTGAGISAESGIQTFRGTNGLWENHRIEEVASPIAFRRDPVMVWNFYLQRRKQALTCRPNTGHLAVAELEKWIRSAGGSFLLVTQNVDGLHSRAGSRNVIEMHGSLMMTRCTACGEVFQDESTDMELPPRHDCPDKGLLRPHIVWFGESLFPGDMERIESAIEMCDMFIVIGTSGIVYPAAGLVNFANRLGKRTVCVNKDAPANIDLFDRFIEGEAGSELPKRLFPEK